MMAHLSIRPVYISIAQMFHSSNKFIFPSLCSMHCIQRIKFRIKNAFYNKNFFRPQTDAHTTGLPSEECQRSSWNGETEKLELLL